jgi:hypothetical protein
MQTSTCVSRPSLGRRVAPWPIRLALVTALFAWTARADTLTNTYSSGQVSGGQTGFVENGNSSGISGQYNFAIGFSQFTTQFDPSLGTLNSITITLSLALSVPATANYQQFNPGQTSPGSFNHTTSMNVALIDFGNHVLYGFGSNASDGFSVPSGGPASQNLQLSMSETFTLTDAQSLADFTVGGNAYPPQFNIGGNGSDSFATVAATGGPGTPFGTFSDTVVFNYTGVPEPSVTVLGLLGIATLGLLHKRSRAS